MSEPSWTGIDRYGLDEVFAAQEVRKSNLILEGQMLEAQRQIDKAAEKFAQAAEQEERLGEHCSAVGLSAKAALHLYSAANCWARAGNFYRAILLCDDLLGRADLPERLHQPVRDYVYTLRGRRAQWATGLTLASVTTEV